MTPVVRARLVGLLGDLARTDVGQLVAASARWLRRQLATEGLRCTQGGCAAPAARASPAGGARAGLCVAHASPPDYWQGYEDGVKDAADLDAGPAPGWAAAAARGAAGAGDAYLVGYTDGYIGAPRR